MEKIVDIDSISGFNAANNHKTLHPLVTVIDYSKAIHENGEMWIP